MHVFTFLRIQLVMILHSHVLFFRFSLFGRATRVCGAHEHQPCDILGVQFYVFCPALPCRHSQCASGTQLCLMQTHLPRRKMFDQLKWSVACFPFDIHIYVYIYNVASVHSKHSKQLMHPILEMMEMQASALSCMVQVKIKKEDFYAASQAGTSCFRWL